MQKRLFFTAGPSQLYSTVPSHIETAIKNYIPSISHRAPQFSQIMKGAQDGLRELLRIPDEHHILFFSSATEIWERLVQNCIEETSFHFVNGVFGERFYWTAEKLGKKPIKLEVPQGGSFSEQQISIPKNAELIAFTHNESSSGVMWPVEDINTIADAYPDALIAIDAVSSMPYPAFNYEKTDAVYFSVQKGFGLPAGLGVLILSPRAFNKSLLLDKKGISIGSYHSFPVMQQFNEKSQTSETPNVLNLYLLDKVIQDYLQYGIEKIRKETDDKAAILYEYFAKHDRYELAVPLEKDRSQTLVVLNTHGESKNIVTALDLVDIEIGYGYGEAKNEQVRVSNFPAHTMVDVERLLEEFKKI